METLRDILAGCSLFAFLAVLGFWLLVAAPNLF